MLFDQYCEWMFPILKELEASYDLKSMEPFQARLIGRVSERLLDIWINKNQLKYKEVGYIYFGKTICIKNLGISDGCYIS